MGAIIELLRASAQRFGGDPRFAIAGERISYGDLLRRAEGFAAALRREGFQPGEVLSIALPNRMDLAVAVFGGFLAGAVVNTLNPRYRRAEIAHAVDLLAPRFAVAEGEAADLLREASPALPIWPSPPSALEAATGQPAVGALALLTSGTTGKPKAAVLDEGRLAANIRAVVDAWGWTGDDTLVVALPLFHMHGLGVAMHGALATGCRFVALESFSPVGLLDAVEQHRATMAFAVPTMIHRIDEHLRATGRAAPRLRLLVSGSAPLPPELAREAERLFGQVPLERYGMSECGMIAGNPLDGPRVPGTVGFPFAGTEVRIVDPESGIVLPSGEVGEVQVRGPSVLASYWRRDRASDPAFDGEWFRTGDLGSVDREGRITLRGRRSELILVGGFNVYPKEVEEAAMRHPAIRECAVLGRPDPDLGEVPVLVASGTPGHDAELLAFLRGEVASYKAPRRVAWLDALPRNAMGKVDRPALARLLAEAEG